MALSLGFVFLVRYFQTVKYVFITEVHTKLPLIFSRYIKNRDIIYARCFLWRQNYPELNYSLNLISGEGGGRVSRGKVMQAL
jgi:hypothetical protein